MKMSKALRGFVAEAEKSDTYWVEEAKLRFALALEAQRCLANLPYKALAEKFGTSAAYISKVFRGDSNLTIESMVKLARASGGRLELTIVDAAQVAAPFARWDLVRIPPVDRHNRIIQTTTAASIDASNNDRYYEAVVG